MDRASEFEKKVKELESQLTAKDKILAETESGSQSTLKQEQGEYLNSEHYRLWGV